MGSAVASIFSAPFTVYGTLTTSFLSRQLKMGKLFLDPSANRPKYVPCQDSGCIIESFSLRSTIAVLLPGRPIVPCSSSSYSESSCPLWWCKVPSQVNSEALLTGHSIAAVHHNQFHSAWSWKTLREYVYLGWFAYVQRISRSPSQHLCHLYPSFSFSSCFGDQLWPLWPQG